MNTPINRDALIAEYRTLIHHAVEESEAEQKLNSKLQVIFKAAQYDGLHESIISNLIDQEIPKKPTTQAA
ncbi:MAG: hypothetical protein H0V66_15225 [Bdellovibrionales bacterium]|nr:hypothetical protein [Bdellovibrionales bacterium]